MIYISYLLYVQSFSSVSAIAAAVATLKVLPLFITAYCVKVTKRYHLKVRH